ncbi:MFS transporter, partial [Mesorhizobium sp. M7A.F.Ca.CA.002.04.1.1]
MAIRDFAHTHEGAGGDALAIPTVAAMIAVLFAGSTVLTPLYIVYKQQFGFSQITLTLIYAVYVVGNLAALLMLGSVSDIVGRRPASLAAMLVAIVSALVFLFAVNVVSLDVARILSGLGIGVGAGTGTAWIAELLPGADKSRASVIATSTNFLGLGLGALISGFLAEYEPWPLRLIFIVYLAALVVVTILVWRTRETV